MTDDKDNDVVQCQDNSPDTRSDSDQPKPTNLGTSDAMIASSPDESVAQDASPAPTVLEASGATGATGATGASDKSEVSSVENTSNVNDPDHSNGTDHALASGNLPACIPTGVSICMGYDGNAYMAIENKNNALALLIGGKASNRVIQDSAQQQSGTRLKAYEIKEISEELTAYAEHSGDIRDVFYRCGPFQNGVELDMGNGSRIRVMPGKVAVIDSGSKTLFRRTPTMRSLPVPADVGDLKLLDKYINLQPTHDLLVSAYLTDTLAHPKVETTSFIILVLQGDQGSGKTFLCKIIQALIDPGVVGVQTFPHNQKDLVVAALNSHVLFYDNMRNINPSMADKLCIAATGGHLTARQLYTDAEQQVHRLHVALVLNGIHSFIDQPDLAQRSLPLPLLSIDEKDRRSETEMSREFQSDSPKIFRGLLDLTADILTHLPLAEVTNPERMYDFSHWLAAMEKVHDLPAGVYQAVYSDVLNEGMLDSLMEDPLASAVMSFVSEKVDGDWSGTPSELLSKLNSFIGNRSRYSREWPQTPSTLSKRLKSLQAGLRRQGIDVQLGRGHERKITLSRMESATDE